MKNYINKIFLLPYLTLLVLNVWGQNKDQKSKTFWNSSLEKIAKSESTPEHIKFKEGININPETIFITHKAAFNLKNTDKLVLKKIEKDDLGYSHYRYQQYYKNVKVEGGEYIVHANKSGRTYSANGRIAIELNINVNPMLNSKQVIDLTLQYVNAKEYMWQSQFWEKNLKEKTGKADASYYPVPQLVIYKLRDLKNWSKENFILAYRLDIYSASPNKAQRIFLNANNGEIINTIPLESNCTSASVSTAFNGTKTIYTDLYSSNYRLNDDCQTATVRIRDWNSTTDVANPLEITSSTNSWTTTTQRFGGGVLWATNQSYNYFLNVHSRQSYDNGNGSLEGYVNAYFIDESGNYYNNNASMSFYTGTMKVGLGSSGTLSNCWGTLDVIGHEYTHAVTGSTAALDYQDESGALNESFSDIFGEAVENYVLGTNDWLIGNDRIDGAIRSMSNPPSYSDPDTYFGTNWYSGTNDNGGVHTNSGVQNFWFYLLATGGSGTNDNGDSYSVTGISIAKARVVAFRNLSVYLTYTSQYSDARNGSISAAEDIYGAGSTEVCAVKNAWYAVGVGSSCTGGGGGSDPCSTFTSISDCGSAYSQTYTGGGSGSWFTSTNNPCNYSTPGIEKIYSFVAPTTGTYSIQVTAASEYVDYLWKSGSCSSSGWNCIADITSTGQYGSMSWTAGTTYYILLDDENSTTDTHTFYINCPIPPDPCNSITSISDCGSAYSQTYTGGGSGSWFTSTNNPCNYSTPGIEKIYSFVAPTTGTYSIQVTAASDYVDYLWKSGSCSSSGWNCIADITSTGQYGSMSWTAGTTYYILLDDENSTTDNHTFYINCPIPLPPDPCNSITSISGSGSGYSQTYTGGGSGSWFTSTNNACNYQTPGIEKIYSFVAPTTETYSIQVTAASGYIDYLWKSGSCSSSGWNCIADISSTGQYGSMSWTAGTTYYILLDDMNSTTGTHTFYINFPDTATSALADYYVSAPYTSPTRNTCGAGNECTYKSSDEQIYEVTIPSNGDWTFSLCGSSYDTWLEIGTSICANDIGYNDDYCGLASEITASITAGKYYVAVEGYDGTECGDYSLVISGPIPNDVGIKSIIAPVTNCNLTSDESITVRIINYGIDSQNNIPVSYQINGGSVITESITDTLPAGDTLLYTFSAKADLSTSGTYIFDAWASLSGDGNSSNDSLTNHQVFTYMLVENVCIVNYTDSASSNYDCNFTNNVCNDGYNYGDTTLTTSPPFSSNSTGIDSINFYLYYSSCDYITDFTFYLNGIQIGTFADSLGGCTCTPSPSTYPYIYTVKDSSVLNAAFDTINTLSVKHNSAEILVAGYSASIFSKCKPASFIEVTKDASICIGDSINLSVAISDSVALTAPYTFFWSPAANLSCDTCQSPITYPDTTTKYKVIVTDSIGVKDSAFVVVTVISNILVANAGTDVEICKNDSIQLNATGGVYYSWKPSTELSDTNIFNPYAFPSVTTNYEVTVSNGCGSNVDTVTVFVNSLPAADAGIDTSICIGESIQLNATGGISYLWSPSNSLSDSNVANPNANPLITTIYSVEVTDSNGCINTDSVTITVLGVSSFPAYSFNPDPKQSSGTFDACGVSSSGDYIDWVEISSVNKDKIHVKIQWYPSSSGSFTTNYGIHLKALHYDGTTWTDIYSNLMVPTDFVVNTFQIDEFDFIIPGGAPTRTHYIRAILIDRSESTDEFKPGITCADGDAGTDVNGSGRHYDNDDVDFEIINNTFMTTTDKDTICLGNSVQLEVLGTDSSFTYAWFPGTSLSDSTINNPIAVPLTTTTYIVEASIGSCLSYDTVTIFVDTANFIFASPDTFICIGDTVQLTATGSGVYLWYPAAGLSCTNCQSPYASPLVTTTYYVTTPFTCAPIDSVTVSVGGGAIFASSSKDSICLGDSTQLTVNNCTPISDDFNSGIDFSQWSNISGGSAASSCGSISGDALYFNGSGSRHAITKNINVTSSSTISFYLKIAYGSNPCEKADAGEDILLDYSTDNGINWSTIKTYYTGGYNNFTLINEIIPVSAKSTNTQFKWRQASNSGSGFDNWAIDDVNIACSGTDTANSYTWSPSTGLSNPNIADPVASPAITTTYIVTSLLGTCFSYDTVTIFVDTANFILASPDTFICIGDTVQLKATGSGVYLWYPATGLSCTNCQSPYASPFVTTTYYVTTPFTCSPIDSVTVSVGGGAIIATSSKDSICLGDSVQLQVLGTDSTFTYVWMPGTSLSDSTINNPIAVPLTTTSYIVKAFISSCLSTDTITIYTKKLNVTASTVTSMICSGDTAQLNATSNLTATSFLWSPDYGLSCTNCSDPTASPSSTIMYYVTGTTGLCTDIDSVLVTVDAGPKNPSCTPATISYCCGYGIYNVTFNTINNTTSNGIDGYQNYSCTNSTNIITGQAYTISIQTGTSYEENVRVWIDYNNDGVFANDTTTELVFWSDNILTNHSGKITIPKTSVLNMQLRMRVGSDASWNSPPVPCGNVYYGQFEDYSIVILPNTIPPVADFKTTYLDMCQGIIQFMDSSTNNPTSWSWDFGDGKGTSVLQNPYYTYSLPGTYNVTLIATNLYGSDQISKTVYFNSVSADYTVTTWAEVNTPVSFTNISQGATSYFWDFGDGYTSSLASPQHTFTAMGTYKITLTSSNLICTAQESKYIKIVLTSTDNIRNSSTIFEVYPNPTNESINILFDNNKPENEISINIYNILGEVVLYDKKIIQKKLFTNYNLKDLKKGVYYIKLFDGDNIYIKNIILQ